MKRIYLPLLGVALFSGAVKAQTPVKESISIVHKITATWCGPCGSWGWDLADEIKSTTAGKALYLNLYASADESFDNDDFYNTTASTLADQITFTGYPNFGANGIDKTAANSAGGGINTTGVKNDCIAAVNAFAATVPVASAASYMSISGNTVTVTAKTKFWSAASGEYYLAAYIVEEGAMHIQNGQGAAPVAHHGVLRASMSAASAWGEQIANGTIAANQVYSKNFTFTVTDTKWDKTKFKIYNVLWKKEGGVYKFVNASLNGTTTSIEDVIASSGLDVFPNPVTDMLHIGMDVIKPCAATLSIIDATGRELKSSVVQLKQGKNQQMINTRSLTPGVYFLNIQTESGAIQKKFVK